MYSQNSEEKFILEYFDKANQSITPPRWIIDGFNRPRFLDIGANDGITFSNTRALAELGSFGVLIEPSPKAFERLKKLYNGHKGFYLYQVAISGHNGKRMLQESSALCSAADVALVSTFHQNEVDRFKRTVKYEPIEVKTFRWKTFLNRLKNTKVTSFDFISIDCEGEDLEILSQIDLSETSLICLEWNSKPELKKDFEHYLDGFKLIYTSGENLLYGR